MAWQGGVWHCAWHGMGHGTAYCVTGAWQCVYGGAYLLWCPAAEHTSGR
jgi:hypothetical protein